MTEGKKRILIGGLFVICAATAVHSLNEDETPSLTWTLLICGMWSSAVWLWRTESTRLLANVWAKRPARETIKSLFRRAVAGFLGSSFVLYVVCVVFFHPPTKEEKEAAEKMQREETMKKLLENIPPNYLPLYPDRE